MLKAKGAEEDYITKLQRAGELRKFFERIMKENVGKARARIVCDGKGLCMERRIMITHLFEGTKAGEETSL